MGFDALSASFLWRSFSALFIIDSFSRLVFHYPTIIDIKTIKSNVTSDQQRLFRVLDKLVRCALKGGHQN